VKRYLLSVWQPDGPPPPPEALEEVMRGVAAWRQELEAAGAWVFTVDLHPPDTATVVRSRGGEVLVTDGPYPEGKEHVGGFTVIRAPDLDAALQWAGKAAEVTTLPVEVRPLRDED
jgi:hypothetical protein